MLCLIRSLLVAGAVITPDSMANAEDVDWKRGDDALGKTGAAMPVSGNTEQVGWLLYTSYLIPFEIASMLLLVAMIGAIVLAKREL